MNEALPKGLTTITRQIENIEKVLYENVKPINLATKLPKKKITTTATTTTTPTTKSTIQKRTETELATATKPKELKPTSQTKTPISTTTLHSTTSTRAPSFSSTSSKLSTRPPSNLVSSPPPQIIKSQLPIVDHPQSSTSAPHQTSDNIQASTLFSTTSRPPTSTISTPMAKTTSGTMRSVSESIFGDGSSLSLLADVQTSMAPSESNWTQDLMEASRKKSTEILGRKNDSRMDTIDKVLTKENLENDAKEEENLDDALLEDEVIKELLDKSINATVSIEDPLTGENKTVIIQVFSTASSLQLGLFLSLPATAVILVALMVACLWRRTSPSSLTRTHSLVNIHQPHLPSRSNLLCPPSSQKKMGRYSMISLPMEIPDLVSSAALQNLMEGSSSLPRYTSSPHVGVQQQHCPVLPGARNLPPSSSSAHGVSPIPRTVAE